MCFSTGRKANSFGKKQLWTFYLTFDFKKSTLFSGMSVFSSPFALTVWVSLLTLAHQRHSPLRTECLMLMMEQGTAGQKNRGQGWQTATCVSCCSILPCLNCDRLQYKMKPGFWAQGVWFCFFFLQGSIFCQLRWLLQRINYLLCVKWVSLIH